MTKSCELKLNYHCCWVKMMPVTGKNWIWWKGFRTCLRHWKDTSVQGNHMLQTHCLNAFIEIIMYQWSMCTLVFDYWCFCCILRSDLNLVYFSWIHFQLQFVITSKRSTSAAEEAQSLPTLHVLRPIWYSSDEFISPGLQMGYSFPKDNMNIALITVVCNELVAYCWSWHWSRIIFYSRFD